MIGRYLDWRGSIGSHEVNIHYDQDGDRSGHDLYWWKKNEKQRYVSAKLNFILTTYYKGTAIENVTKKLEEYLDNANKTESDINNL